MLRWIICDQQAFSVVDDKSFVALISALDPCFKLPTRQTISNYIQRIYDQKRIKLRNVFENFDRKVAITTDAWTACTNQAYLSVTLHWITNDWCLQHILLDLIPLHERHTGIFIAESIMEQIKYFGLGSQVLSLTADNAANMDVCSHHLASLLELHHGNTAFRRVRCAAHILNLAVTKGISIVDESIKKAREFASHIRRSQPCFEELKKVFAMKNKPFLVPDLDVETRWNSMYLMLEKLCKIREMTDILVVSMPLLKQLYPTDRDWEKIKDIMTILEPIYKATKLLFSSNHPTIGDLRTVFFVITELLTEAQTESNSTKARVAKKISEKLDDYWDELKSCFLESVLLDPSTKFTTFRSNADKFNACQTIQMLYEIYAPLVESTNQPIPKPTSVRDYFRRQIKRTHNDMINSNSVLDEYLDTPDEDVDVLLYWKSKASDLRWAPLVKMARDYLVVQATSVPSEQVFSIAKHTISAMHNQLDAEKARASLCLKT